MGDAQRASRHANSPHRYPRAATLTALTALAALALSGCSRIAQPAEAVAPGVVSVSSAELDRVRAVNLADGWEFYWGRLLSPDDFRAAPAPTAAPVPDAWVSVPDSWSDYDVPGRTIPGTGYATYRLLVEVGDGRPLALRVWKIGTASTLWINGEVAMRSGVVGTTAETTEPSYQRTVIFIPDPGDALELVVQVANFDHARGGIREAMELGLLSEVRATVYTNSVIEIIAVGVLLIIALYHVLLFLGDPTRRELFWFSLFCLSIFVRIFIDCSEILFILTSQIPWRVSVYLDYATLVLIPYLFFLFLASLYPERFGRRTRTVLHYDALIFSILIAVVPLPVVTGLNLFFMLHLVAVTGYLMVLLARAIGQGERYARFIGAAAVILLGAGVHDMLLALNIIGGGYLLQAGTMAFFFFQAIMLAGRVADQIESHEKLQQEIQATNLSYARFVPAEFIHSLGRHDITGLALGDHIVGEVTVMFVGLVEGSREYEELPEATKIAFLEAYIREVDRAVGARGGFIDKCVGTDIMVLFTAEPEGAWDACCTVVAGFTRLAAETGLPARVGIGIHTGVAALGIIGETERLESTVISDSVNVASRLKGANRTLGTTVLLSSSAYAALADSVRDNARFIGRYHLKGKIEAQPLFEVFAADADASAVAASLRRHTRDGFERAVALFSAGAFAQAREGFTQVARTDPSDPLPGRYLERIEAFATTPPEIEEDRFEDVGAK